jgi:hypothetical protein
MLLIDKFLRIFNESTLSAKTTSVFGPIASVEVFNEKYPTLDDAWPQLLKSGYLLTHCVAAILDEHVDAPDLTRKRAQKTAVLLIADPNLYLRFSERCALWINVHANYAGMRTEVMLPHLQ